jgi:hypothetical protein
MDINAFLKNKAFLALAVVVLVIAGGIYYLYEKNKPEYGTWRFGVCKTFIETQLRFPDTLWITAVIEDPYYAEIYASYVNAHGMRPTRVYKCNYKLVGDRMTIDYINIDNERIDDKIVKEFNMLVPMLINNPDVDLELPEWLGLDIKYLRQEYRDRR